MHDVQAEMISGQINTEQLCRACDNLIAEMKTKG